MLEVTCEEIRREVSNYMEADLTAALKRQIDDHVRRCPGCKAVYDGVRNVISLVGHGAIIELPSGFSERLYRKLANK
jgi:predicted anti-sigma-YlaC factor YlaD